MRWEEQKKGKEKRGEIECVSERGRETERERSAKKDCSKMQQISELQSKVFACYRREYSALQTARLH